MPAGAFEKLRDSDNFPDLGIKDRVIKVVPTQDYKLYLTFKTGEKRVLDFKPFFKYEFYKPLKDLSLFMRVKTDGIAVYWNDELDIAPEWTYLDSDPI